MIKLTWLQFTQDNKLIVKHKQFETRLECEEFYSTLKHKNNYYMKVGCSTRVVK